MKSKINKLREDLHMAMENEDKEELIKISRRLDQLIVEYYEAVDKGNED